MRSRGRKRDRRNVSKRTEHEKVLAYENVGKIPIRGERSRTELMRVR